MMPVPRERPTPRTLAGEPWLCPRALLPPLGTPTHSRQRPPPWWGRRIRCCSWLPWESGWAEPRQASWCSRCCRCAGGHAPPRGSGEGKEGAQGWLRPKTRCPPLPPLTPQPTGHNWGLCQQRRAEPTALPTGSQEQPLALRVQGRTPVRGNWVSRRKGQRPCLSVGKGGRCHCPAT